MTTPSTVPRNLRHNSKMKREFPGASSSSREYKEEEVLEVFPPISHQKLSSKLKEKTFEVGNTCTKIGADESYKQIKTYNNTVIIHQNHTNNEISSPQIQNPTNPNKRAKTWDQEETQALICFRKEIDSLFNTSKSNKHLWENISIKMSDKGFYRSPSMCTDRWRNLMKDFKNAGLRNNNNNNNQEVGVNGNLRKMGWFKEIEKILDKRSEIEKILDKRSGKNNGTYRGDVGGSNVDAFMQFPNKTIDDVRVNFGHVEDNDNSTLNLETPADHNENPLAIIVANIAKSGASPWQWRETPVNGDHSSLDNGRVIKVKHGDYIKRVGIDATHGAIKESIRSAFRLRTKRAFWLEDEDNIVRAIDRDMPSGNYTLHVDEGMTIKMCLYDEEDQLLVHTENKTFYTEEDFQDFMSRRGWTCLRECSGCCRYIDSMDDLCVGSIYRGVN